MSRCGYAVFQHYPELAAAVGDLCHGKTWGVTGVSALVYDGRSFYFEITKPEYWHALPDGRIEGGIGAIGGSVEAGEELLDCLDREMDEEIGCRGVVESRRRVSLVYEEETVRQVTLRDTPYPGPALLTISRNIHRQTEMADCDILVIVTFATRIQATPTLLDLYGVLSVEPSRVATILTSDHVTADALMASPGVHIQSRAPLPTGMQLVPVWTGRSLQIVAQRGFLADALGPR